MHRIQLSAGVFAVRRYCVVMCVTTKTKKKAKGTTSLAFRGIVSRYALAARSARNGFSTRAECAHSFPLCAPRSPLSRRCLDVVRIKYPSLVSVQDKGNQARKSTRQAARQRNSRLYDSRTHIYVHHAHISMNDKRAAACESEYAWFRRRRRLSGGAHAYRWLFTRCNRECAHSRWGVDVACTLHAGLTNSHRHKELRPHKQTNPRNVLRTPFSFALSAAHFMKSNSAVLILVKCFEWDVALRIFLSLVVMMLLCVCVPLG